MCLGNPCYSKSHRKSHLKRFLKLRGFRETHRNAVCFFAPSIFLDLPSMAANSDISIIFSIFLTHWLGRKHSSSSCWLTIITETVYQAIETIFPVPIEFIMYFYSFVLQIKRRDLPSADGYHFGKWEFKKKKYIYISVCAICFFIIYASKLYERPSTQVTAISFLINLWWLFFLNVKISEFMYYFINMLCQCYSFHHSHHKGLPLSLWGC